MPGTLTSQEEDLLVHIVYEDMNNIQQKYYMILKLKGESHTVKTTSIHLHKLLVRMACLN